MPQSTQKNSAVRHAPPLAGSASKQKHWGGRGAGTPAPQLPLVAGKIWCGQILPLCLKKEQKSNGVRE
ncbi:MAG: hypothetical protein ISS45_09510 [Candidatus Omnitrophica bacterium]|nr:hypothetical protein [Candidatus Omnitrophota bacterium]